jgi:excisionase family DNA binding protein
MAESDESRDFPYISVIEAAQLMGVSKTRMYEYIEENRIPKHMVGGTLVIDRRDLGTIERKPTGRLRKKAPKWRTYHGGGDVFATEIRVQIRAELREQIKQVTGSIATRLKGEDEKGDRLTLKGSIARYVLSDHSEPYRVSIWLIWKDTELPDKETHEREMEEFKNALADVLDWSTAEYSEKDGIVYT